MVGAKAIEPVKRPNKLALSFKMLKDLEYHPHFLKNSELLYATLSSQLKWEKPSIKIFGKSHPIPRQQAFYGDANTSYKYSHTIFQANPWHIALLDIKQAIEELTVQKFNCVLCNKYANGRDYMSLHSDNEPELGKNPVIASVSLGGTRTFVLQKKDKSEKHEIELNDGDLLIMKGQFQEQWNHGIKKTMRPKQPRINLTFRNILK